MSNNPQFPGLPPLRPPMMGSVDPPRNFAPPMPLQFRPAVPAQQQQQFISQLYPPIGPGVPLMNVGMPSQNQQSQFVQAIQQMPPRQGQQLPLPSQAIPLPVARPNMPIPSESMVHQSDSQTPNGYTPGLGGSGLPLSSSYTYAPSSYGQVQSNFSASGQYQPAQTQALTVSSGEQLRAMSTASGTSLPSSGEQPSIPSVASSATNFLPDSAKDGSTDWIEHTSANGRRFYYNKKTKVSSWEKPFELMTPIELRILKSKGAGAMKNTISQNRFYTSCLGMGIMKGWKLDRPGFCHRADASTNWKEYTSPDGRKYYYNKATKESKWTIPEELKLAREQIGKAVVKGTEPNAVLHSLAQHSTSPTVVEAAHVVDNSSLTDQGEPTSPISVAPVVTMAASNHHHETTPGSSASPAVTPISRTNMDEVEAPANTVTPSDSNVDGASVVDVNTARTPTRDADKVSSQDTLGYADGTPVQDKEDVKKEQLGERTNEVASETKTVEPEPLVYANKMEAKNVFKALLESANVGSDWTWDRAMRVIINDKRYGALKSLGERKQVFNEFLNQKKKQEAEEKRMKQKKAREDFKKMLEESTELTSSTRWSKAVSLFENDDRFKAVERDRDRRDLFDSFMEELVNKERARAQEERKRNIMEYRRFLESCDFIKASTQWRKVQDRLEADERCSCLEKIDRLEIFQDYLHDLEKEEEEQKKIQKEELRKAERRNRDEFRKLMEEDVAAGTLTAKTHWRDYYLKVKDLPAYVAVASNTSGSTPKDLFEDVAEELEKQYHEDKARIKDAVKLGKITLSSTWTLEDFKTAMLKDISSPPISDVNTMLVFDELLERARDKEEKEAKKRKRLGDNFFHLLYSIKDINSSSNWEDFIPLFDDSQEFRSIGDENYCKELFEKYVAQMKEEAKESERKWKEEKQAKKEEREDREKRKGKQRREREKEEALRKDKTDSDNMDTTEIQSSKETKRSEEDGRKQRKQHQSPEHISHETDKERTKKSRGHSGDRKKSSRHASGHESDNEARHKKHKKDHRSSYHRDGGYGELEDGEFGEDGERW